VGALANAEVGRYVNEHFVSSFQKVATFTIVNGQKQGGNVASYFCAPDGRVLHAIAGPVDAATFLREAKWTVETARALVQESVTSETPFRTLFRRRHAERLRNEFGLVVEAAGFDVDALPDAGDALTYRDPTGRPLVPVLPPPPIDGPDVGVRNLAKEAAAGAPAHLVARDKAGRRWQMPAAGRVHQLMSSYSMLKIERLYGTVFENILGERISTKPVLTIGTQPGRRTAVCLTCESQAHRE
jgi:hypothetical protein